MFCFHCQETTNNLHCDIRGVCGKSPEVAALQDLLVYALKGLSLFSVKARDLGNTDPATDLFVVQALFATLSNVNFDEARFVSLIHEALARRDAVRAFTHYMKNAMVALLPNHCPKWRPGTISPAIRPNLPKKASLSGSWPSRR